MYTNNHYVKRVHFFFDQTEHNSGGNESIILIHSDSGGEDLPENIHSPTEIDEESSDVAKMENIFSSYCAQKKV